MILVIVDLRPDLLRPLACLNVLAQAKPITLLVIGHGICFVPIIGCIISFVCSMLKVLKGKSGPYCIFSLFDQIFFLYTRTHEERQFKCSYLSGGFFYLQHLKHVLRRSL